MPKPVPKPVPVPKAKPQSVPVPKQLAAVVPKANNRRGALVASLSIGGKSYSGLDIDALFGGQKKDKAFADALIANPSLVIDAWQVALDTRELYSNNVGVKGPFLALKSNDNMIEYAATLEKQTGALPKAWKDYVKTNLPRVFNENGLPGASTGEWAWGLGYTFHIIRKRHFILGNDAVAKTWAGGADGAGSRLLRYWLTDEHFFTKPVKAGDTTVVLPVSPEWSSSLPSEVSRRLQGNNKCEFPVGLAMAWQGGRNDKGKGGTASYHATWDLCCCVNNIFEGGGASVFSQITDPVMRKRIGSAMENLVNMVKSNANDFSGYKETGEESKAQWRSACAEELPKAGVQYILKSFGRL